MLVMLALGVTTTLSAGILVLASTIGTAQAVGCHHFQNQGADCIDGFLCVHQTGTCRQTGPSG
jgi:hypothetical protein